MTLTPIGARVVVKLDTTPAEQKVGNLYVPGTTETIGAQAGIVIAVGDDPDLQKMIKIGDRILFPKYKGTEIEVDGVKYVIVDRDEILAEVEL